jgi:hypothetical protein
MGSSACERTRQPKNWRLKLLRDFSVRRRSDYVNAKHTRRGLEQYAIDAHRGLSAVKCKDLRYRKLRADRSVAALQSAGHSRK